MDIPSGISNPVTAENGLEARVAAVVGAEYLAK